MLYTKFDHSLKFPDLKVMMTNVGPDSDPNHGGPQISDQTKIYGIVAPLIAINENVLHSSQVKRLTLKQRTFPELTLVFEDTMGIIKALDGPDMDYTVQLQIIPPADNMYKKINLTFRCNRIKSNDYLFTLSCSYLPPSQHNIYDSIMKSYGEITSYELFEQIAKYYQLGFVSNVDGTADKRWIYNPNLNLEQFLNREIRYSGLDQNSTDKPEPHVFDWWVDFYNNLYLVDMYSEYKEIVTDEDYMTIWTTDYQQMISTDEPKTEIMKNMAMVQNYPSLIRDETYLRDEYKFFVEPPNATDINFETFNMTDKQRRSTIISNGDVQKIFTNKYSYGGELFGEYDYLTKAACRSVFLSKINGQGIEVILRHPMFAFWQGRKINMYWFDTNMPFNSDDGADGNETLMSNIPMPTEMNINNPDANFRINKTVSGQYMVISTKISYDMGQWTHTLRLSRYADQIQKNQ